MLDEEKNMVEVWILIQVADFKLGYRMRGNVEDQVGSLDLASLGLPRGY